MAAWVLLLQAQCLLSPPVPFGGTPVHRLRIRHAAARMEYGVQKLEVTLTGCENGIGVGLNPENRVDLLRPGTPAAAQLRIGDHVTHWDGQPLMKVVGGRMEQVKLITVAPDPLVNSYTLTVERSGQANGIAAPSWESKSSTPTPSWESKSW